MKTRLPALFALAIAFAAAVPFARAQTALTTFRPSLVESFAASYSYSGKSAYKHDAAAGETSVSHFSASAGGRAKLGQATFLNYGLAFVMNKIDSDAAVPVPERLGELSITLGVTRVFSPQWRGAVFARPGYYGDMEHYTARAINAPVIAMAIYAPSPRYLWTFGVAVNPFGEYAVMPVVNLRWAFAEKWSFNLGFPRFGVTWQVTKPLELGAHITMQGGGYRTTQAPNNTARADLANTYMSYRELRVGVRAAIKIFGKASLALEGGWMADRRFDYFDRDYELKSKPSAYGAIALDVKL